MYKIEKKSFGYYLTFGGYIQPEEMQNWHDEALNQLKYAKPQFGVFVDMRTLKPLPPESQSIMQKGQKHFKDKGMIRSAVILDSAITTMQFKRIAKDSGIYNWERYIDASANNNWEQIGIDWIENAIDPDA